MADLKQEKHWFLRHTAKKYPTLADAETAAGLVVTDHTHRDVAIIYEAVAVVKAMPRDSVTVTL